MNFWFPKLNSAGEVVRGAGEVFFQDRALGLGHGPDFVTDDIVVFSRPIGPTTEETVIVWARTAIVRAPLQPAYNRYAAGAAHFLGFWAGSPITLRLHDVNGAVVRQWTECGNPAMSPSGRFVYSDRYHGDVHTVFLGHVDTSVLTPLYEGPTMDLSVCETAAVIQVATGKYTRAVIGIRLGVAWTGQPEDWSVLDWERPVVCEGPDGPWVCSETQTGLMLRPAGVGVTEGYVWNGEWFNPCVRFVNGAFVVEASDGQGQRRHDTVNPSQPRVPIVDRPAPPAPAPPAPVPVPPAPVPPAPHPVPPDHPGPTPAPTPPLAPAFLMLQPYEVPMADTKIVAIKGPGGKFGRPDAAGTGPFGNLGWRAIVFDRETPDDACKFELSKPDEGFKFKHTQVDGLLGLDATPFGNPNLGTQFYLKPGSDRGAYESPSVYKSPRTGQLVGFVETYVGGYPSCGFQVVVL